MKQRDIIMGALFLIFAIVFYVLTYFLAGYELETIPNDMGPTFMPRLLLGALGIEALILLISTLNKEEDIASVADKLKPIFHGRPWIMLGVFLLYIYLATLFGYIISTIAFMIIGFLLLGVRNILTLIIVPPIITVVTFFLFGTLLNIYLPSGSLF